MADPANFATSTVVPRRDSAVEAPHNKTGIGTVKEISNGMYQEKVLDNLKDFIFGDILLTSKEPLEYMLSENNIKDENGEPVKPKGYLCRIRTELDAALQSPLNFDPEKDKDTVIKQIEKHGLYAPVRQDMRAPLISEKVRVRKQDYIVDNGMKIAGLYEVVTEDIIIDDSPSSIWANYRKVFDSLSAPAGSKGAGSTSPSGGSANTQTDDSGMPFHAASKEDKEEMARRRNALPFSGPQELTEQQLIHHPPQSGITIRGNPSSPSIQQYIKVAAQFDVENNPRYFPRNYAKNPATFCDVFCHDVMYAMNVPYPWWVGYKPSIISGFPIYPTYENVKSKFLKKFAKNGIELTTSKFSHKITWLNGIGKFFGWRSCDESTAQMWANKGHVAITICPDVGSRGHIVMIMPGNRLNAPSMNGATVMQAGAALVGTNKTYGVLDREVAFGNKSVDINKSLFTVGQAWGSKKNLHFFYHDGSVTWDSIPLSKADNVSDLKQMSDYLNSFTKSSKPNS